MAIPPRLKAACQAAIADHLEHTGGTDWSTVRAAFPGVAEASFWRMVRAAKAGSAAPSERLTKGHHDLVDVAREPLHGLGASIDPQAVLAACLENANAVAAQARTADGKIRSPKLALAAAKLMTEVLRTAAAVSSVLLDERQTRDFYRSILAELEAESPELKERIAARFEALTSGMTLRPYVGR